MQEWSCRHIKQLWYRWSKYSVSLTRDPTVDCSWVGLMDQFTVPPPSLCRTVKCYKLVKVAKEWRNASFICNQWHLSSRWPVKSIFELSTWIWSNVSESWMEDTLLHSTFHWNCLSWNKLCVDLMIVWTEQYIQYWHLANECPAPAPTTRLHCGLRCAQFKPYKRPSLTNFMAEKLQFKPASHICISAYRTRYQAEIPKCAEFLF